MNKTPNNNRYLSRRSPLSWEVPGNKYSKWRKPLDRNIHWDIDSFQTGQSKSHIGIIEDWKREQSLGRCHIQSSCRRVSHISTNVNKQRGSQLLKNTNAVTNIGKQKSNNNKQNLLFCQQSQYLQSEKSHGICILHKNSLVDKNHSHGGKSICHSR